VLKLIAGKPELTVEKAIGMLGIGVVESGELKMLLIK